MHHSKKLTPGGFRRFRLFHSGAFVFFYALIIVALFVFSGSAQKDKLNELKAAPIDAINLSQPLTPCPLVEKAGNDTIIDVASDNVSDIIISFQNGKIIKLNLIKKFVIWSSELGGESVSNVIYDKESIYLVTRLLQTNESKEKELEKVGKEFGGNQYKDRELSQNYLLWSLDSETGVTKWQFPFTAKSPVLLSSYQNILVLNESSGTLTSVQKPDPQTFWKRNLGQNFSSSPSFNGDNIYIGTNDNSIVKLSAKSGEIISKLPPSQSSSTILIADGDKLFRGEKKGILSLSDTSKDRVVWSVRFGGEISSLTRVSDGLLVSSFDNFVYLVSQRNGRTIWKRRLSGRIIFRPLIIENQALMLSAAGGELVVLNLSDGKILNQISLAERGFVLSMPVILEKRLVLSTTRGIFSYSNGKTDCSEE